MLTPEENLALAFVLWGIALSLPVLFLLLVPSWIASRSRSAYLADRRLNLSASDSPVLSNRSADFRVEAAESFPAVAPALGVADATPAAGLRARGRPL